MASLKDLLNSRASSIDTIANISSFSAEASGSSTDIVMFKAGHTWSGSGYHKDGANCWAAPSAGTAKIEIWGGGGSSGLMCCCGWGMPGNAGGYVTTQLDLDAGELINYCIGINRTSGSLCCGCRGCCTCFCVTNKATGVAEGGWEGRAICNDTTSGFSWCCAVSLGIAECVCDWSVGTGCALVRNPCAEVSGFVCDYGSFTSNTKIIPGPRACFDFRCCYGGNGAYHSINHIAYPGGLKGLCGGTVSIKNCHCHQAFGNKDNAINALSLHFTGVGSNYRQCWGSHSDCGCYETAQCQGPIGIGVGSPSHATCAGTKSQSSAAGTGAIRITFTPA